MSCAVRRVTKWSKVKDIKAVEVLCSLGYPMYEANADGESIFFEVFSPTTSVEFSDMFMKLFIKEFNFDCLRKTKRPSDKKNEYTGNSA